jgi:hypothetical protein
MASLMVGTGRFELPTPRTPSGSDVSWNFNGYSVVILEAEAISRTL